MFGNQKRNCRQRGVVCSAYAPFGRPCVSRERGESKDNVLVMGEEIDPECRRGRDYDIDLDRAMELQKRALIQDRSPSSKRPRDCDQAETRPNSRGSMYRRGSPYYLNDATSGARLSPSYRAHETVIPQNTAGPIRRKSTGRIAITAPHEIISFAQAKRPIRPLNLPRLTQQLAAPTIAPTENELIANKLEAIEERKDPERQWAKTNKYTVYVARGFGAFSREVGRGTYGIELQKSTGRQTTRLKPTLWDMKIRVPPMNRITSGMDLSRWGAEDGRNGTKDAIVIGDCYPMDTR